MDTIIGALTSGTLIVALVGGVRWFFKIRGKEIPKSILRWSVYGLSFISTAIVSLVSKDISFTDPSTFMIALSATFATAETLYRIVAGKLNLKKEA